MRRWCRFASLLVACVILSPARASTAAESADARVTVLAAASLTEAFKSIGSAFEKTHPGLNVEFSFGASSTLVIQIKEGAPGDVFASADESNMQAAADAGELAGAARIFATNRLTIVVPKGNPKRVTSLADLSRSGVTVALAAPQVPAGKYAAQIFTKAGVAVPQASQELDVRAVLNKVAMDEADAGIVYVTDIRAGGGKVEAVPIPEQYNVVARYPIAVLKHAAHPKEAQAFVDFVLSPPGQATLAQFGFAPP
jgi:molybdate transport system substrate-binding protein